MSAGIQKLFTLFKICLIVRMRKDAKKGVYWGCEVHKKQAVKRLMHCYENFSRDLCAFTVLHLVYLNKLPPTREGKLDIFTYQRAVRIVFQKWSIYFIRNQSALEPNRLLFVHRLIFHVACCPSILFYVKNGCFKKHCAQFSNFLFCLCRFHLKSTNCFCFNRKWILALVFC